jgi:hypothetical protein
MRNRGSLNFCHLDEPRLKQSWLSAPWDRQVTEPNLDFRLVISLHNNSVLNLFCFCFILVLRTFVFEVMNSGRRGLSFETNFKLVDFSHDVFPFGHAFFPGLLLTSICSLATTKGTSYFIVFIKLADETFWFTLAFNLLLRTASASTASITPFSFLLACFH